MLLAWPKLCPLMNELNGLINLISSTKHNKPAKVFGYFPDAVNEREQWANLKNAHFTTNYK